MYRDFEISKQGREWVARMEDADGPEPCRLYALEFRGKTLAQAKQAVDDYYAFRRWVNRRRKREPFPHQHKCSCRLCGVCVYVVRASGYAPPDEPWVHRIMVRWEEMRHNPATAGVVRYVDEAIEANDPLPSCHTDDCDCWLCDFCRVFTEKANQP